ncbi:MAG: hypothetical protein FAF03_08695 [Epsilonproteobacteria bacterium]|nr:hypothetical protein [Campylobacterota bacterium]
MKMIILLVLCTFQLQAASVVAKWQSYAKSTTNGTVTTEKEYLSLNGDNTFSIQLFVSLQKGDAFIKDLRIEGSGIWKRRDDTLVIYIQKVEVPFAKEIYLISQESLRNLANNFKYKYENEPLKIIYIEELENNKLVTKNEQNQITSYNRQ